MPSLEQLLANVQGVKDLPEEATRKSVGTHTHSDVYRGAVKAEKSIVRRLNGLVQAVREGKISKDTALKAAEIAVKRRQATYDQIAISHAKRALKKDVITLPPEQATRSREIADKTLAAFKTILDDIK